jgi:hypothetical protein
MINIGKEMGYKWRITATQQMTKSHRLVLICKEIGLGEIMTGSSTGNAVNQRFIICADSRKNSISPKKTVALA